MRTLRVGIATYQEMKARSLAIARGQYRPGASEPKIWFSSAQSFARVLSDRNRELLMVIATSEPASLTDLASLTGRKKSNLSRTLKTMQRYGFVSLETGPRGALIPRVSYDRVSLTLPLAPPREAA
jgi:predicted transcriptional regulator